jgi:hypothetical protein
MKYYKKIDINNYDTIVSKALEYVKSKETIFLRRHPGPTYHCNDFLEICPEINDAFKMFNINCISSAFYVMYNNNHSAIHVDSFVNTTKINLPILNCKNTYTVFYKTENKFNTHITEGSNSKTWLLDKQDGLVEEVDRVEIDKTTIIRVGTPHRVILSNFEFVPRITLTLGFSKDPKFLLE